MAVQGELDGFARSAGARDRPPAAAWPGRRRAGRLEQRRRAIRVVGEFALPALVEVAACADQAGERLRNAQVPELSRISLYFPGN